MLNGDIGGRIEAATRGEELFSGRYKSSFELIEKRTQQFANNQVTINSSALRSGSRSSLWSLKKGTNVARRASSGIDLDEAGGARKPAGESCFCSRRKLLFWWREKCGALAIKEPARMTLSSKLKLPPPPRAAWPIMRMLRLFLVVIVCCSWRAGELPFYPSQAGDIIPSLVECSHSPSSNSYHSGSAAASSSSKSGQPASLKDALILRDQKLLRPNSSASSSGTRDFLAGSAAQRAAKVKNPITRSRAANSSNEEQAENAFSINNLQISITPRVSLIRVPSDSNAILKCLISSSQSMNKLNRKLDIRWSRYMYDENVYEQIESLLSPSSKSPLEDEGAEQYGTTSPTPAESTSEFAPSIPAEQESSAGEFRPPAGLNRQQQLRDFLSRIRQEANFISDLLIEATLSISPVRASDNATYYCTATDGFSDSESKAKIDLVALSRPNVRLDRLLPARDSKSALVYWSLLSDGNTPVKKTILMVRNDTNFRSPAGSEQGGESQAASGQLVLDSDYKQWQRFDIEADGQQALEPPPSFYLPAAHHNQTPGEPALAGRTYEADGSGDSVVRLGDLDVTSTGYAPNQGGPPEARQHSLASQRARWRSSLAGSRASRNSRSFNLSSLLPGVTYNLRLAAINDMGQSNWTYLTRTMPNEIPAQIGEVYMLNRRNDTLVIGWRRPSYDNARTIRYEMQLFDLNRTLTLDANTNTSMAATSGPGQANPSGPPASNQRTNYMYVFFNLNPGTDYHFHVRACSKAGCSQYSSPKLLATTLDGEPDEPLDVELNCQLESNRLIVSWLPPINVRGQLLSYSLQFEASARFRNESNKWALEEWRSMLETSDNHTLTFEISAGSNFQLSANTNYSVRVCANNRSKQCGRFSGLTQKSQCQTSADLPEEMPSEEEIKFSLRNVNHNNQNEDSKIESLVLEMPFLSGRNGSIDCVQLALIRLPKTYTGYANLSSYLPAEASDIKLKEYDKINEPGKESQEGPQAASTLEDFSVAYLAEELDWRDFVLVETSSGTPKQQVVFGDGTQNVCRHLRDSSGPRSSAKSREELERILRERFRVFDGTLRPQTYYTGFIKLLLRRPLQQTTSGNQFQLVTKYSHYFRPVKTGASVIEVPLMSPFLDDEHEEEEELYGNSTFSLNARMSVREMISNFASSLALSWRKFYRQASRFAREQFRFEQVGNYMMQSSPTVQLLSVSLLFTSLSLMIIFCCWLMRLAGNRKRKKRLKMKRKLLKHQEALQVEASRSQEAASGRFQAASQQGYLLEAAGQPAVASLANGVQLERERKERLDGQLYAGEEHKEPPSKPREPLSRECPIHSSPQYARQPEVQMNINYNLLEPQQPMYANNAAHTHAHHHHHLQQQHQQQFGGGQQHYGERNCRTLRRLEHRGDFEQQFAGELVGNAKSTFTLSHSNVVSTLAKRFNKSIPINLFGSVFERKLRDGWLADEYEQLPRPGMRPAVEEGSSASCWLKLKPQMVVSRDDSVSALISGRDTIDASLIKPAKAANSELEVERSRQPERRIICAKSPLDADSVWDFWRLIYEQEVSTLVMLTQTEDMNTGELRCAQYWPTQDNEETTILSPCNDYVQRSPIPPAKFKIRQETFENESRENDFKVRRLTLVVMATKPGENLLDQSNDDLANNKGELASEKKSTNSLDSSSTGNQNAANNEDESEWVIVERLVWHLQFYHWNTSSLANQMRLIKFVEMANEKHSRSLVQESPSMEAQLGPMLVHCYTGLGRSGLFTAMSYVVDELARKLASYNHLQPAAPFCKQQLDQCNQQQQEKLNLFQLVSRLRLQRDMILSPYRFYELLYQLTANCIPSEESFVAAAAAAAANHQHQHHQQDQRNHHYHHHHHLNSHNGHHHHHHHHHNHQQQAPI